MFRTTALATFVVFCAASAVASPASAQDGSTVSFEIRAVVQPFCRIQSEIGDKPGFLVDGAVELGAVRELCNTPGGYNVDVQLINVSSGLLSYGSDSQTLDEAGRTRIQWGMPRFSTVPWRLTQASLRQQDMPVYLRVSISPI